MQDARAIIRYSIDRAHPNEYTAINSSPINTGFDKIGTCVLEGVDLDATSAIDAVISALEEMRDLQQGTLDHIWIYIDRPDSN